MKEGEEGREKKKEEEGGQIETSRAESHLEKQFGDTAAAAYTATAAQEREREEEEEECKRKNNT